MDDTVSDWGRGAVGGVAGSAAVLLVLVVIVFSCAKKAAAAKPKKNEKSGNGQTTKRSGENSQSPDGRDVGDPVYCNTEGVTTHDQRYENHTYYNAVQPTRSPHSSSQTSHGASVNNVNISVSDPKPEEDIHLQPDDYEYAHVAVPTVSAGQKARKHHGQAANNTQYSVVSFDVNNRGRVKQDDDSDD